jgi:peptidoglycan-N-acetylglucosamine deacetylase
VGLAVFVAGCSSPKRVAERLNGPAGTATTASTTTTTAAPVVTLDVFPPPHPGEPHTIFHAPTKTNQIALTIDDGYCDDCVASYVAFAKSTGIHITFSPNGAYQHAWNPQASVLRPLIEAGQVQIGNHTYSHHDLRPMSASGIEAELERNETWIQHTFGVTTRPWYRPPFGFHTDRVDDVAGQLGYTHVLMWNGTYGDSGEITPAVLMDQATKYLTGGTIMLGHANHPTVTYLFGEIQALLSERHLDPVTLDEMFGTSRRQG